MRWTSRLLAAAAAAVVGIPGARFVLSPLLGSQAGEDEQFHTIGRLSELEVGKPRSFSIVEPTQDAWVKYPPEPVGMVWAVRQPEGGEPPVLVFTAECPHLACIINLSPSGDTFFCPCHTSSFTLDGERINEVPPRGMDRLEVAPIDTADPEAEIKVQFARFRTMSAEKIPLA